MRRFVLPGLMLMYGVLAADAASAQTGTQSGVTGNPNCPQPVLPGGIRPRNWSCPTGTQSPFPQQNVPTQQAPHGSVPMQSQPGPGEVDTADRPEGQAGGKGLGRNYNLDALRCSAEEAIVGVRLRRGHVLDYLQIACARPHCAGADCRWETARWGKAAGNPHGGNPQRPILCHANEVLTGFRARVVTFTVSDYVADIEIECSRFGQASGGASSGARGIGRVGTGLPNWRHSGGGLRSGAVPGNVTRNVIGAPISCRPNGNARAFSVAESDFVRPGQRVVQAISLYCPDGLQPGEQEAVSTEDMMDGIDRCLYEHSRLGYYESPNVTVRRGRVTYQRSTSTVVFDPPFLEQQRPYPKAFWLAAVYGAHVANLEQILFGVNRPEPQRLGVGDYVAGFIAHCLVMNGLLPSITNNSPDDPRLQYDDFLQHSGFALPEDPPGVRRSRVDWENGWHAYGMGLHPSLRHQ